MAMSPLLARRHLLRGAALLPLVAIGACTTPLGSYSLGDGIHRLLTLSSQRAFARLLQPGGFYDDQLTRITVPQQVAGGRDGDVLATILRTRAVRDRIAFALNDVAVDAADRATPVVLDAIRGLSVADAVSVLRGGPTAATTLLERQARGAVVEAMFPEIGGALRSDGAEILGAVIAARTGVDYTALARDVAEQAGSAIFRAIGREEAAIRADPLATRDPVLIAVLGGR